MSIQDKVNTLLQGFNTFHNAINYISSSDSHVPFRIIITTPNHDASNHTVKVDNDSELQELLSAFKEEISKNNIINSEIVDKRLFKSSSCHVFIQYLTV